MLRSLLLVSVVTLSMQGTYGAQSAAPIPAQDPSVPSASAQSGSPSLAPSSTSQTDAKKPKKVWTKQNLSDANGPVSVVGNAKSAANSKSNPAKPTDPNYAANIKK